MSTVLQIYALPFILIVLQTYCQTLDICSSCIISIYSEIKIYSAAPTTTIDCNADNGCRYGEFHCGNELPPEADFSGTAALIELSTDSTINSSLSNESMSRSDIAITVWDKMLSIKRGTTTTTQLLFHHNVKMTQYHLSTLDQELYDNGKIYVKSIVNIKEECSSFEAIFYIIYAVGRLMMMIIIVLIIGVFINDAFKSIMIIIWIMSYITSSYGADYYVAWSVGGSTMPRATDHMAVGYDGITDTIWILGGWGSDNGRQLVSFHNNTFTDYGASYLWPYIVSGSGQFYTQIDNILYIGSVSTINTFNVETLQFQYGYLRSISNRNNDVLNQGCLTSISNRNHDYLIVNGGYNHNLITISLNETRILNLTSNDWLRNVPGMQHKRARHSCIAHKEYLYAFGGLDFGGDTYYTPSTSIELLFVGNLINIQNETWHFMDDLLNSFPYGHRSVVVDDDILIFGETQRKINVIHTTTKRVLSGGLLQYYARDWAPIVVYPFIYVIGGRKSSNQLQFDIWQYHDLSTITNAPTTEPTTDPTTDATTNPTSDPISDPTTDPTTDPTSGPISDPTTDPTTDPTSGPISDPTTDPTTNPTSGPISDPTTDPITDPTTDPASDATSDTTSDPSRNPINDERTDVRLGERIIWVTIITILVVIICFIVFRIKKNRKIDKDIFHDVEASHDHHEMRNRNQTFSEAIQRNTVPSFYEQVEMNEVDNQHEGH